MSCFCEFREFCEYIGFGKKFGRKTSSGPRAFDPSKKTKSSKNVNKKNKKNKKKKGKNGKLDKPHWSEVDVLNFNKKKVTKQAMDELNFALTEGDGDNNNIILEDDQYEIHTPDGDADLESSDDSSDDDDFADLSIPNRANNYNSTTTKQEEKSNGGITSGIWNRFSKLIGNKPLTEQDVNSVLRDLENSLSSKNVANIIARELCDSLRKQLVGMILINYVFITIFILLFPYKP